MHLFKKIELLNWLYHAYIIFIGTFVFFSIENQALDVKIPWSDDWLWVVIDPCFTIFVLLSTFYNLHGQTYLLRQKNQFCLTLLCTPVGLLKM